MKSGSGGASAPSAGGSSLAIAERQKPAPSCVAALFQMFARRKLFSSSSKKSKLLPPVRAHKFSPGRPAGSGEKTAAAKPRPLLLNSADYSRSKTEGNGISCYPQPVQDRNCGENEMCAPGVVARLMGLSSMPAVSHQRPTKATDSSGLGDHRNSGPQDWSGTSRSIYTSPQKQQKTGQGIDDRQKDNGSQFSAPDARLLWPRRHAHEVASPVKSPRSMSSRNKARLIEAAVKVLEPGLQSRNRRLSRRHAYLEYPCSSDDCVPAAAAADVLHNLPDQFSRDMPDVDAQRLGAHNIGATSLHNSISNKWIEEDPSRKSIQFRSGQNVLCQIQPEGNGKCFLISSSEKAGFEDSAKRTSNCVAVTNQDARKNQPRNMSRDSARRGPLKQNNLKQNALPEACIEANPGYIVQRNKHRSGEQNVTHTAQDFVSLNKRITGSKSLRSKRKELDRFGGLHTSADNTNMSTKGRRSSSLHSDTSNKLKLKPVTPKAMEKDMIIAKGAGLVSEKPKPANQNCAKSDFQRQTVLCNVSRSNRKSGIVSLSSSSPVKVDAASLCGDNATTRTGTAQGSPVGACLKRHSRKDCLNTSPQRGLVFREALQGISSLESAESVFFNQNELKNRDIPGGRAASSLFEKKGAVPVREEFLSDAPLWQSNSVDTVTYGFGDDSKPVHLDDSHKKHEADAKGCSPSPSISRSRNKKSPTSILQSKYADDAFTPGIHTAEPALTDCHPTETRTPAAPTQDATTKANSRCSEPNFGEHHTQPSEPAVQDSELNHPGEVTTTVELLLTNVRSSARLKSKEPPSKTFLLRTIEAALATLTPGSNSKQGLDAAKAKEASSLRSLALDFVWDCLDSMCTRLCDSGYRSFAKLGVICTEERLAAEVRKEIGRCSGMAGRSLDELAVSEVERAVEDGMGYVVEAFQIGAQIERDLVQELVDEIVLELISRSTRPKGRGPDPRPDRGRQPNIGWRAPVTPRYIDRWAPPARITRLI